MNTLNEEFEIVEEFQPEVYQPGGVPPIVQHTSPPAIGGTPPPSTNRWDPRLLLDLAVGVDPLEEILFRYNLTLDQYEDLLANTSFRRALALTIRDAREEGVQFSQKAKIQAESYLVVLDEMIYNRETPASTRLEAIRSAVKWGRLEVDKNSDDGLNGNQQINISINF